MSSIDIKDQELEEEFDEDYLDEGDYEFSVEGGIEAIRDELATQSELLEQFVALYQEKLDQDRLFQDRLIKTLETIADK